jgi:hypothetical protein
MRKASTAALLFVFFCAALIFACDMETLFSSSLSKLYADKAKPMVVCFGMLTYVDKSLSSALATLAELKKIEPNENGNLMVKAWTKRGNAGTYLDGEEIIIHFYANADCSIKIVASIKQFKDINESFSSLGKSSKELITRGLSVQQHEARISEVMLSYTILEKQDSLERMPLATDCYIGLTGMTANFVFYEKLGAIMPESIF